MPYATNEELPPLVRCHLPPMHRTSSARLSTMHQAHAGDDASVPLHHWDEPNGAEILAGNANPCPLVAHQTLRPTASTHGCDENPPVSKLVEQRSRNLAGRGSHQDAVEGSALGPTIVAVASAHLHIEISK